MDTFRIKIKNYIIQDQRYFEEIKSSDFANGSHKTDKTNNSFRNEMVKKGIYIPKYRISEVNFGSEEKGLVLEFSASKFIHGTNLKEVTQKDLPILVDKLALFLKSIKALVLKHDIENAIVTGAAYSKNISVGDLGSAQEIIRVIAPFDYRPRSQYNKSSHKKFVLWQEESATELKYFNNNSHFTAYDKLAEIQSNPVTNEEQAIVDFLKHGTNKESYEGWVKETLRVELTLHNKVAVRQALSKIYPNKVSFTLTEAFNDKVCETLLREEVDKIFNHPLQKIVLLTTLDREVFNKVINEHCATLGQRREMRVALDIIYTRGLKAYRNDVLSKAVERTWFRKQKLLKRICDAIQLPTAAIEQVDNAQVLEYLLSKFGIKSKLREQKQLSLFKK